MFVTGHYRTSVTRKNNREFTTFAFVPDGTTMKDKCVRCVSYSPEAYVCKICRIQIADTQRRQAVKEKGLPINE